MAGARRRSRKLADGLHALEARLAQLPDPAPHQGVVGARRGETVAGGRRHVLDLGGHPGQLPKQAALVLQALDRRQTRGHLGQAFARAAQLAAVAARQRQCEQRQHAVGPRSRTAVAPAARPGAAAGRDPGARRGRSRRPGPRNPSRPPWRRRKPSCRQCCRCRTTGSAPPRHAVARPGLPVPRARRPAVARAGRRASPAAQRRAPARRRARPLDCLGLERRCSWRTRYGVPSGAGTVPDRPSGRCPPAPAAAPRGPRRARRPGRGPRPDPRR